MKYKNIVSVPDSNGVIVGIINSELGRSCEVHPCCGEYVIRVGSVISFTPDRVLKEFLQYKTKRKEQTKREKQTLLKEVEKTKCELQEKAQPQYEAVWENLTRITLESDEATKKMESLYAKQNRGRAFHSVEQRDTHLSSQIAEFESLSREKQTILDKKRDTLSSLQNKTETDSSLLESKKTLLDKKQSLFNKLAEELEGKKKMQYSLADSRRESWRCIDELQERLSELREEHRRIQSDLRKVTPRATSFGLQALGKIVEDEAIPSDVFFGTVMENLKSSRREKK